MSIQEVREAMEMLIAAMGQEDREAIMAGADAYALAAHVDAHGYEPTVDKTCGDGWYCERAEAIRKLGGSDA